MNGSQTCDLPLNRPQNPLERIAHVKELDNPNISMQPAPPINPTIITGFRPTLSDMIPHSVAVSICGMKKADAERNGSVDNALHVRARCLTYQSCPKSNVPFFNVEVLDHEIYEGKEEGGCQGLGYDNHTNESERSRYSGRESK